MEILRITKESFSVIGKEGSTKDGEGFIEQLWENANSHFNEVSELAKKDENGNLLGVWGAMSDFTRSFKPWENDFKDGLYLAGVEVYDDAQPPQNLVKWTIPAYEYIYVKVEDNISDTFPKVLRYLSDNNLELVGAVNDYICPKENGQLYMFFPIKKL